MGCGSCGTRSADGKPSGCQSNGGCSSGGCNRLNVFNWLSDLPFGDLGKPYPVMEVSFNNGSRKDFYRNNTPHIFDKGDWVAVEGAGGFDVGEISLSGELVKLQMKKYGVSDTSEIKKVLRPAGERDMEQFRSAKDRERETLVRSRAIARELKLEMKIAEAEFQADGKKVCFFYTADSRVDFRELIKVYASEFRAKIEMRQIGARQESAKVGGIGSCGRELCCSSWLSDFKTVNTTAARYQNLSINQTKLSGQCGRLKCCLNYELDTYMDALHGFPEGAEQIEVASGRAFLQKKDIFRNLMWYSFAGSNKQYPLTIERVQEIQQLNRQGEKPEDLEAVEIQVRHKDSEKTVDMGFVNDVGQLTLSSLSKSNKKKQQQSRQKQQAKDRSGAQQPNRPQERAQGNNGKKQGPSADKEQQARPASPQKQPKPAPQGPRPEGQGQQQGNKQQPRQGQPQQPQPNRQQPARPRPAPQGQQPQGGAPARPQQQPKQKQAPQAGTQVPPGEGDNAAAKQQRSRPNRPPQERKERPQQPRREQQDPGGTPPNEQ